jgi:tRNA A37 threonylcarbamoyladenosine dehydratase
MDQHVARFGGIGRLYGEAAAGRLRSARVCVIGVGGVGSWAVEALARSGLGSLTLVDMDDVCITNVNRQLHAVDGSFGKPKVEVMRARVQSINPECRVEAVQSFFLKSTAEEILSRSFDAVVDAIDQVEMKALLIALCCRKGIPVVTTGGAGGRRDPAQVQVVDLARSSHDGLLQAVRKTLRAEHGFPRGDELFGVDCVLSREPVVYPQTDGSVCDTRPPGSRLRLDCRSGYGTAAFVTGTFGFVAASRVIELLTRGSGPRLEESEVLPETGPDRINA